MKVTEQERKEAIENLKKLLRPGQTVYTIKRHTSASGLLRVYSVVLPILRPVVPGILDDTPYHQHIKELTGNLQREAAIVNRTYTVATVICGVYNERWEGIAIHGGQFDGGESIVYDLSYVLFGSGHALYHQSL
jgi:hypothetical protein